MRIIVCDMEVFSHDWLFVGRELTNTEHIVIVNSNDELKMLIEDEETIFCGFNMKNYDQFIIKSICLGLTPEDVKKVNDHIIDGGNGWEISIFNPRQFNFNYMDIMDDMQIGTSLKSIEGHLGMNIEETKVDFNTSRSLTPEEMELVIHYCKHDVDTTVEVVKLRNEYLKTKIKLGAEIGLSEAESLSLTNAKLTSKYLGAVKQARNDEREYQFPKNLLTEYIPKEVMEFFSRIHDKSIPDEEVFNSSHSLNVGGCEVVLGFGGIHGAIPNAIVENTNDEEIQNWDIASYYPNLMIQNHYVSRNIPSPKVFEDVVKRRIAAKRSGDKELANALKLIINTTYGATLNKYNDLYDPLMARSVCISGQLYMLELACNLTKHCESLKIIQLNTDGIMFKLKKNDLSKCNEILTEWQERTGFELEEDKIAKIIQKDVNNYIEIGTEGQLKTKGAYFKTGVNTIGAFSINNNMTIVSKAILDYFTKDIPVELTINNCDNIFEFQLIAKASSKYDGAFQYVNGERVELQKCNRAYATTNKSYSTIYKYRGQSIAKIAGLPDSCLIDNSNELNITNIDKQFYIQVAKQRIRDFYGKSYEQGGLFEEMATAKKTEEKVVETTPLNIFQKLFNARIKLSKEKIEKTGVNPHQRFKYFELEDIVPAITKVLQEQKLLDVFTFPTPIKAVLKIINIDNPEEVIEYEAPMKDFNDVPYGNAPQNVVQYIGAEITYMRRYLYLTAMNLIENDLIDGDAIPKEAPKKSKAPATVEKREEIVENLTKVEDQADKLQLEGLKRVCKELSAYVSDKPEVLETIVKIGEETEKFTKCSKTRCEQFMMAMQNQLEKCKEELGI